MKRIIKFRAWDGEQMISPDYIDRKGIAWWKSDSIPQCTGLIMQFTGLNDKNGKGIYEGDIVNFMSRGMEFTGLVTWSSCGFDAEPIGEFCKQYEHMMYFPSHIEEREIIGNIYENPNLIA